MDLLEAIKQRRSIRSHTEGEVTEEEISELLEDAYDGTPTVDLKAYLPVCDRVKEPSIPEWLSYWPEWMPEEGIGLED